ncbi:RNA-splicing ligase RtcB [Pseudomonas aeruginosa]|nr:RNA-splicing ligase RtcB [Pseudomonas aeruginosa]
MIAARTAGRCRPAGQPARPARVEQAVPHGKTFGRRAAWHEVPEAADQAWKALAGRFKAITDKHPRLEKTNNRQHLGTLGTGNHFIEVCLDEADRVWFMLHSGSRGSATPSATCSSNWPRRTCASIANLPDKDLLRKAAGTDDYVEAVGWAPGRTAR